MLSLENTNDLSKLLELFNNFANLEPTVRDQLQSVLGGEAVENQNPEAIRDVKDFTKSLYTFFSKTDLISLIDDLGCFTHYLEFKLTEILDQPEDEY